VAQFEGFKNILITNNAQLTELLEQMI